MSPSRRLAAIMFSDIVGYTRMMQLDEQKGGQTASYYRQELTGKVLEHRGEILSHYGDGSLTIFDSVIEAINCAREVQLLFQEEPRIPLRIGIHLGDIVVDGSNSFGDGINVASRLESVGKPGSVLFSKRVKDELENHPEFNVRSLGIYQFKNVRKPSEIFALEEDYLSIPSRQEILSSPKVKAARRGRKALQVALGAFMLLALIVVGYKLSNKDITASSDKLSIAVLPFDDNSPGQDQEWFCNAMTDQIISNLLRIQDLTVIAGPSSKQFKDSGMSISEFGNELNVGHVLKGSVVSSEGLMRIISQLIKVEDGSLLWGDEYDEDPKQFFKVQDDVSRSIVMAFRTKILQIPVDPENPPDLPFGKTTNNLNAFRDYQLAKHYYDSYDSWETMDYETSLRYFNSAIAGDTLFADAYVGKANLLLAVAWRRQVHPDSLFQAIITCIDKAKEIDPLSGLPYSAEGQMLLLYNFDFKVAEEAFIKATELTPSYDVTYANYFRLMFATGKFDRAEEYIRKAIALNPLNSGYHGLLAELFLIRMELDSALVYYERNLEIFPGDRYSLWGLGLTYCFSGDHEKGIDFIENIPGVKGTDFGVAYFSALAGDTAYARKILDWQYSFLEKNPDGWKWPIAVIYTGLGEYEKAIDLLEQTPHDLMYSMLWFKPLRTHPRFLQLLRDHDFDPTTFPN